MKGNWDNDGNNISMTPEKLRTHKEYLMDGLCWYFEDEDKLREKYPEIQKIPKDDIKGLIEISQEISSFLKTEIDYCKTLPNQGLDTYKPIDKEIGERRYNQYFKDLLDKSKGIPKSFEDILDSVNNESLFLYKIYKDPLGAEAWLKYTGRRVGLTHNNLEEGFEIRKNIKPTNPCQIKVIKEDEKKTYEVDIAPREVFLDVLEPLDLRKFIGNLNPKEYENAMSLIFEDYTKDLCEQYGVDFKVARIMENWCGRYISVDTTYKEFMESN